MFLDCFGKRLRAGDDVIITIDDVLYDGFVVDVYGDMILFTYHYQYDEEDLDRDIKYYDYDTHKNKLLNIYKI